MEYDKRNYQKANDKKVLHKIRKHWVVVSTALLMALGGGAVATHVSANADATNANNGTNANNTNTIKERINQQLQTPQKQGNNSQAQATINNENNSQNNTNNIVNQAKTLHNRILMSAGQGNNANANQPQANDADQNANAAGQGRVAANAPKISNNVHVNKINANGITKQGVTNNNGAAKANVNNNKVDLLNNRPKQLLGNVDAEAGNVDNNNLFSNPDGSLKNGFKYNTNTKAFYLPYSDATDPYGRSDEYGKVTVMYVDPSDGNRQVGAALSGASVLVKDPDNTPFGNSTDPNSNNVNGYSKEIPQLRLGDGDNYGYSFAGIDSGSNIGNYVRGENQYLVINVHRNAAPAKPGTIVVNYLDADNGNINVGSRVNSDSANAPFNQSDYTTNVPNGYQYLNKFSDGVSGGTMSNTTPITKYGNGNTQELNLYVAPKSKATTATVIYKDAKSGTTLSNQSTVSDFSINGFYGHNASDMIPYAQLEDLTPAGYTFDNNAQNTIATNDPQYFGSKTHHATVYIEVDKNSSQPSHPKDLSNNYGQITVHYRTSANASDIKTIQLSGTTKTSFNSQTYDAAPYLPIGYNYEGAGNNAPSSYEPNKNQDYIVLVNKSANSSNLPSSVKDYIEYDVVNPAKPSDAPTEIQAAGFTNPITITGAPNARIDYTRFEKDIPQGYTFWTLGSHDANYGQGETNHILLESNNSLVGTTTINYYDQSGQKVNDASDNVPINSSNSKYGEHFTAKDLATNTSDYNLNHKVPSGYTLNSNENNQEYQINSDNQTINLLVNGSQVNSNKTDSRYNLQVKRIIKDQNGHFISSDEQTLPISGNNGDVVTVSPNSYIPNPTSDYSLSPSNESDQQLSIVPIYNGTGANSGDQYGIKGLSPHDTLTSINNSDHKMTTTFTYVENNATATVLYKDPSDGDNIVGSATISGTPNTPMSTFYSGNNGQLNKNLPYGYNHPSDVTPGTDGLVNGSNYVINVKNAHLASGGHNTLPDQGYVNVVYGTNLNTPTQKVYSTVTMNGTGGFNSILAQTSTEQGGWMPDVYQNPSVTDPNISSNDSSVNTNGFEVGTPQTYYVDVDMNTSAENQPVTDMIVYKALDANGSVDTSVGNNSAHNNGIVSDLTIKGKDGNVINYAPYQNNIPNGYAYYGQTKTNSSIYNKGMNTENDPVAVVYVMAAQNASNNRFPGYDPDNDTNHNNGSSTTNKKDPNVSDGSYYPFLIDPSGDVPLKPSQNPHDPITKAGFNGKDMPSDYDNDNNGDVPTGYDPGWISDGQGNYRAGYVPSDNIPSGYVPGLVPNGKGDYVAGYVPSNPKDMPQPGTPDGKDKNGKTVYVPKYVPGNIPDGNGGTTPGYVPATSKYAKDTAGILQIQYVDADNHQQVVSDFLVGGSMGSTFDLKNANHNYLKDLPFGYDNAKDLGEEQTEGNIDSSKATTNDQYNYDASTRTINIAIHKIAVGNVIYEDLDNDDVQVGSSQISGDTGTPVNFGSNSQYMQLLPYNYNNPTVSANDTKYTNPNQLYNGATYVIGVHEAGNRPATAPQPLSDDGTIVVNYVNSKDNDIVGTESFVGKKSDTIPNPANSELNSTYIPYDYDNANGSDVGKAQNATFTPGTPGVYNIHVDPVSNASGSNPQVMQPEMMSNTIGYQVVTSDGNTKPLVYTKDNNGVTYAGEPNASTKPVYFRVTGQEGSAIDYTPYQTDVPNGYEYDGMGDYSGTIDAGHTSTTNSNDFDTILLRNVKPAVSEGNITITYKTLNPNVKLTGDSSSNYTSSDKAALNKDSNYTTYDTISVSGVTNSPFDQGYYEDDLPNDGSWQFDHADNSITQYTNSPQNLTIYAAPGVRSEAQFSNINVHFIDASKASQANDNASTPDATLNSQQPSNYVTETMSGHVGDLFSPQEYEYNTPTNTTFDHIIKGNDIATFNGNDQNVYIAVNPTSND